MNDPQIGVRELRHFACVTEHLRRPGFEIFENGLRRVEEVSVPILDTQAELRYTGFLTQDVAQAARDAKFDFSGVKVPEDEATQQ